VRNIDRPRGKVIWYRGAVYWLDLVRCRRALVKRQVEGELHNMTAVAVAAGVSRSTASRFFGVYGVSLAATLRILDVLRVEFDEVARPLDEDQRELNPGSG
jgi:hypothetical protein